MGSHRLGAGGFRKPRNFMCSLLGLALNLARVGRAPCRAIPPSATPCHLDAKPRTPVLGVTAHASQRAFRMAYTRSTSQTRSADVARLLTDVQELEGGGA